MTSKIVGRVGRILVTTGMASGIALGLSPITTAAPVTPEDLANCVANGGDKVLCCARYGGDYTESAPAPPKNGVVFGPTEMCVFEGGARVAFSNPGTPSAPPPKPGAPPPQVPAAPRS
jgi:hypothetical protein